MKKISILGSTGSIGTQTLDVVREHGDMQVVALSCGRNLSLIEKQAREFKPQFVSVSDENDAKKLRTSLADTDIEVGYGMDGNLAHLRAEDEAFYADEVAYVEQFLEDQIGRAHV